MFVGVVALTLLAACSGGKPSAGDGRVTLQDRIRRESEGRIALLRFEKTNGQQDEVFDVPLYELQWTAEIEFREDCKWVTGLFGANVGFQTRTPPPKSGQGFGGRLDGKRRVSRGPRRAGDRATHSRIVTFRKTKKRCRPGQCTIGKYQLLPAG